VTWYQSCEGVRGHGRLAWFVQGGPVHARLMPVPACKSCATIRRIRRNNHLTPISTRSYRDWAWVGVLGVMRGDYNNSCYTGPPVSRSAAGAIGYGELDEEGGSGIVKYCRP